MENKSSKTVLNILFLISFSHLINDLLQGLLPSLYPLFGEKYGLNFTQIGLITFAFQFTASILQPIIGNYTDKFPKPYSQVIGMLISCLGVFLLSMANSFNWLIICAILIGIGSAIFHPESGRIANLASGGKLGLAQSIFQTGGNLGSALAPLAVALIVIPHTQKNIIWFTIVAVLGLVFLTKIASWFKDYLETALLKNKITKSTHNIDKRKVKLALIILLVIVFSKFIYSASLSSYYIFYIINKFNLTIQEAQFHMFIYLFAYMLGTIIGGPLGDKFGRNQIIWFSVFGATPFALLLPYANLFYTDVLMIIIGLIMSSAFPAIIVYAQELIPQKVGMISGLFYGFAFGMAAIGSALLGILADYTSIQYVYQLCSFLPILGAVCFFLPKLNYNYNEKLPALIKENINISKYQKL